MAGRVWGGSLHQTFRFLPPSPNLAPFLASDGLHKDAVLAALPYDRRRGTGTTPDPRRYRDGKQLYQTMGLLHEDQEGRVHVTDFGFALGRWLSIANEKNVVILARHAAYALAACQLRNPTQTGAGYDHDLDVFPFAFIWRAIGQLDGRISTDELNRAIFRITSDDEVAVAVEKIAEARRTKNPLLMGAPTITGTGANDRVITWMAMASFGWTLILDKRASGGHEYVIAPRAQGLVRDAAAIQHRHRDFGSVRDYVEHLSMNAGLPPDLR